MGGGVWNGGVVQESSVGVRDKCREWGCGNVGVRLGIL